MEPSRQQLESAVLRFVGDQVDPARISSLLGLEPTEFHVKGTPMPRHPSKRWTTSLWILSSGLDETESLSRHLTVLVGILEKRNAAIKVLIQEGCLPRFYCGVFYTGSGGYVELTAEILLRTAALGATLEIHCYESDDGDNKALSGPH